MKLKPLDISKPADVFLEFMNGDERSVESMKCVEIGVSPDFFRTS